MSDKKKPEPTGMKRISIDKLTPVTSRIEVGPYVILFNNQTEKIRVYDEKKMKVDAKPLDMTNGLIFNSEDDA